jgi:uncharacterized OB-fold protein
MNNGAIAVTLSLAVLSIISTNTAMAEDEYKKTQVVSQTNECGNYWFPINVICSNINTQIMGDENNVAAVTTTTAPQQESESIDSGTPFP